MPCGAGRSSRFCAVFLPYENGTPSHDQLGLIFAALADFDADSFQRCFISWAEALSAAAKGIVAVDGKTLRRSFDRGAGKGAVHMVSAWSSRQNLVLGQRVVDGKSNEITAIPELLELLALEGAIVTIDAMGCQKAIAQKIVDKKPDYVLGLKGNQGTLRQDVELLFTEQEARGFAELAISRHESVGAGHGRIETRTCLASEDIAWLKERHPWAGLRSIVMVRGERQTGQGTETDTRFFISSLPADAERLAEAVRGHWGIENRLHWVMDVVFRDDDCRIRKKNAPANFAAVKNMATNLLRNAPGKLSLKSKRHLAAWNQDFLAQAISR